MDIGLGLDPQVIVGEDQTALDTQVIRGDGDRAVKMGPGLVMIPGFQAKLAELSLRVGMIRADTDERG